VNQLFNVFNALNWLINGKTSNINALTANDYYDRLKLIALSLFEWENLPDSCNPRFLEQTLYLYGRALFIYDDTLGYLNTKVTPSGKLNIYDEPVSYTAYGIDYNKIFDKDDCVIIRNNYLERPTDHSVILFASRLTEAERTIDVNIKAQKTPVLVRVDEKDRLTIKNLYKQYEGNEPFILGGKSLNPDGLKVLKTDAPYVVDKIQKYKHEIWNEALTFFGINNTNTDKRERLTDDEVNANNEIISLNAQTMLLSRQEAAEAINKKYGLKVSVKMREFKENQDNKQGKEVVE
jgi:hypothetical protein